MILNMSMFHNLYNKNVHSQNGEDGILEELLLRLNITSGYVCEFGAWDGIHLSNTFSLVEKGFSAVYIEGDSDKFKDLLVTQQKYPAITAINEYVDHIKDSEKSLDAILKRTAIPLDFDIVSIDIDSFDYQIWKHFNEYAPKIVVIEINSSIDPKVINHIHTPGVYSGTGFRPMYDLAIEKGYTLITHTGNMIFVKDEYYGQLNIDFMPPLRLFNRKWLDYANNSA